MDITRPALAPSTATLSSSDSETRQQLAHALFERLNSLFQQDPLIDELGLVLNASPEQFNYDELANTNATTTTTTSSTPNTTSTTPPSPHILTQKEQDEKSPAFLLKHHKLGIAFWCIPYVFKYTTSLFKKCREQFMICKASSSPLSSTLITSLITSSRCLLLINADHYTAWNIRKQLILAHHIDIYAELRVLSLIYTKHPKSGEAWAHRRWVLNQIEVFQGTNKGISSNHMSTSTSTSTPTPSSTETPTSTETSTETSTSPPSLYNNPLFMTEISICERTAELYPKNYYAWTHRQWLVQLLTQPTDLESEMTSVTKWTDRHISDHCGFHHRQIILQQILLTTCHAGLVHTPIEHTSLPPIMISHPTIIPCYGCSTITNELDYTSELIERYPGHETLWYHRKFLYCMYIRMLAQHHGWCGQPSTISSAPPVWLDEMCTSEMDYAWDQSTDHDLANHIQHSRYASTYRLYVYEQTTLLRILAQQQHSSMTSLTYQQHLNKQDRTIWNACIHDIHNIWPQFQCRGEH